MSAAPEARPAATTEPWSVCVPASWPVEWTDEPEGGDLSVLVDFQTEEEARGWIERGCPGILAEHRWHAGWQRRPCSPSDVFLSEKEAAALNFREQRDRFDYFRRAATVVQRPHDWGLARLPPSETPCRVFMDADVDAAYDASCEPVRQRVTQGVEPACDVGPCALPPAHVGAHECCDRGCVTWAGGRFTEGDLLCAFADVARTCWRFKE